MITVADGPIVTGITDDAKRTFDAETVTYECELNGETGNLTAFVSFIDVDGKNLIRYRGPEYGPTDITMGSESVTNPNTIFRRELEKAVKSYLETANPTATFTIV